MIRYPLTFQIWHFLDHNWNSKQGQRQSQLDHLKRKQQSSKLERVFRGDLGFVHITIFQENVLSVKLNFSRTVPGSEMSNEPF